MIHFNTVPFRSHTSERSVAFKLSEQNLYAFLTSFLPRHVTCLTPHASLNHLNIIILFGEEFKLVMQFSQCCYCIFSHRSTYLQPWFQGGFHTHIKYYVNCSFVRLCLYILRQKMGGQTILKWMAAILKFFMLLVFSLVEFYNWLKHLNLTHFFKGFLAIFTLWYVLHSVDEM